MKREYDTTRDTLPDTAGVRKWFGVERAEVWPTFQRFLYLHFLLVSFIAAKSLRDATFLDTYGAINLPVVYILLTASTAATALFYNRLVERLSCKALFRASLGGTLLVQIVFLFLYSSGFHWVPFVYYLFVAFHGVLIAQFWLFLARTYDIAEAKRLMAPIGAGGILGAVTGGFLVRLCVTNLPVHFLLYLSIASIATCLILFQRMWRGLCPYRTITPAPLRLEQTPLILTNTYLRKTAVVFSLVAVTAIFVEYQMNVLVERQFETPAAMASFFGTFYLILSAAAMMVQLFLARPLLFKTGVVTALVLLPLGIVVGATALVLAPALWVATITRIWDGGMRHSLYRTAAEILYLPLSEVEKIKTKILLDTFVPKLAEGFAGMLLLLATQVLLWPFKLLSIALALFSGSAVLVGLSLRREYIGRLRQRLETTPRELARVRIDFSDRTTLATIARYLNSLDPTEIVSTLRILENAGHFELIPSDLLLHPNVEVKKEVLRLLPGTGTLPDAWTLREHFDHPDTEVAVDAVRVFARFYPQAYAEALDFLLQSDRPEIRAVAAEIPACIEDHLCRKEAYTTILAMAEQPGKQGVPSRKMAARSIGNIARPEYSRTLARLLEDDHPEVVRAAIRAAGRAQDPESVARLINLLGELRFTHTVKQALTCYGAQVIGALLDRFRDESTPFGIRVQIPDALGEIQVPETFGMLQDCMNDSYPMVRSRVLRATYRMQQRSPGLRPDRLKLQHQSLAESKAYFELLNHCCALETVRTDRKPLVLRALWETAELCLGNLFRSLDLLYPGTHLYSGLVALESGRQDLRPWAKEMVDTLVKKPKPLREALLAIMGGHPVAVKVEKGNRLFGLEPLAFDRAMMYLCTYPDHWLVSCALYSLYELNLRELFFRSKNVVNRRSKRIRDTLAFVSMKFEGGQSTDAFYH